MNLTLSSNIDRAFRKYVSTNMLSMLGSCIYVLADTFFVAQGVGSIGLTALNLVIPVYCFVNGFGMMIGMGASTRYSILKGRGDRDRSNEIFSQGMIVSAVFSIIVSALCVIFAEPLCRFLGADAEVLPHARIYMRILISFSAAFIIKDIFVFFVRNDDRPGLAMISILAGSIVNIILDYVFIMKLGWGMFGAAFATGFAPIVSLLIIAVHFIQKRNKFKFSWVKPKFADIKDMASLGVPGLIAELSYGVSMFAFNYVLLKITGNIGVAAYSIIVNLSYVGMGLFMGAGEGIQPLVSINHGARNTDNILTIYRKSFRLTLFMGIFFYLISLIFTDGLVKMFMNEPNQVLYGMTFKGMRIYNISFIFAGVNIAVSTLFSSVAQPLQSFVISMIRAFIGVIVFVIVLPKIMGITGVWLTMPLSEFISFIFGIYYMGVFRKLKNRS